MIEALQFDFMQNAIYAGLLASLACGIIGALVVVNRIVFISGGIAHAAYGGIGLAFYFGWPYMAGTLGFSLISAWIMAAVTVRNKRRSDTVIGVLWAMGMALGVLLMDLSPGYNVDLMSFLFGSILTVPDTDLQWMVALCFVIVIVCVLFYNAFLAMSFDEEFARTRGVPVTVLHFLLLSLIAVSVVLVIRIVGLILVIALLTIPPFISERYAASLFQMMVLSTLLSVVFTLTGLYFSYTLDLTSGATIIMVAGFGFLVSLLIDHACKIFRKTRARRA